MTASHRAAHNGIRSLNVAPIVDDSYDADYMPLLVDYVEDVEVLHPPWHLEKLSAAIRMTMPLSPVPLEGRRK